MKRWLQYRVMHWQYNPYGSRRHNFAFKWLTGGTIKEAITAAKERPYRFLEQGNE